MEERYLKGWQKVAYGSGDLGSNFMFTFVASFVMIYITNTVGLNAGIIGTLMMVSKCLDGVTDVIFGGLIDNTKSKMGKARPWLFWSTFPLAVCEILLFMIPGIGSTLQYAYFFIVYTLLNACFYTANNISYASLTALITKNPNERVQIGSIRFMFALIAGIAISSMTVELVNVFGGGAAGWRVVAILYSLIMVVFNMICVLSVRELADEKTENKKEEQKRSFGRNLKLLISNKYYLLVLAYYLVTYLVQGISGGVGIYFCTYALGDPALLGMLSMASMIPMVIGLILTPFLVKKFGIYQVNVCGAVMSLVFSILTIIVGYNGNFTLMLVCLMLKGLGASPAIGTLNAVIAEVANYTHFKDGVRLEGSMYSCSSMGMKVGSGVGSALCGWLLAFSGYDGLQQVQSANAVSMIQFMYLVIPAIASLLTVLIIGALNVQKANKQYESQ